jgi:epoxyqueuosine reductase
MTTRDELEQIARRHGCAGFGVCRADPYTDTAGAIAWRRATGLSGHLAFTYRNPARATDVAVSFPWARRLVVLSWSYLPAAGDPGPARPGTGRVARFATTDHYRGLRNALGAVRDRLRADGSRAETLVDDNRLVDRAAAVRAGVGWWGKSTMVLDPRHGPWLLLGSVVTDAVLPSTAPMIRGCGTCTACLPACPTGAIVAPGVLDARRCLAHWSQVPGIIPWVFRPLMGDRVYGCDDCLDACPPGGKLLRRTSASRGRIDLVALLAADDTALLTTFSHFYVPQRDPRYLRRNLLVALGNSGGADAAGALASHLTHPDWLLRAHAAWALGAAAGPSAAPRLAAARRRERHPAVRLELEMAMDGAAGAPPRLR